MSEKILVTGAAGYIGSHMCRVLKDAGYTPVGLDDLSQGFEEALLQGMPFLNARAGDKEVVTAFIRDHQARHIIHFAGYVINTESVSEPYAYYENNVFQTLELCDILKDCGVENFIYSSSAGVYGDGTEGGLLTEDSPKQPMTPYGASKHIAERMIEDMAAAQDFRYVCLRYFNVAGAGTEYGIGQRSKISTHLIKIICEALAGKRDKLALFGTDYPTPDGTCIRDYIHVLDLCHAHLAALEYLIKGGESIAMNCGYGRGYSVREVIDAAFDVAGESVSVSEEPRRIGDPPSLVASNETMRKLTGWTPQHDDLHEIIRSALEWEKSL